MRKLLAAILLLIFTLTACITDSPAPITGTPRSRSVEISHADTPTQNEAVEHYPIQVPVLFQMGNFTRGIYEPSEGIYLGAWLAPHTSKRNFVYQTDKNHAVFVHEMHLCAEIPITWLLQCMAVLATPLFIVHPPQDDELETPIGDKLSYLAHRLGTFNLPMFVAFYPSGHGMTPQEYSVMFRYARALFLQHAPQVAFVWVAPSVESTARNPFFPGHDAVDWVGVPLFAQRDNDGFAGDIIEQFTPFYHQFQAHHPIMVLPLGVSHFSRSDHSYHLQEAAAEILRVYQALAGFPRLGLVVYADAFRLTPTSQDDFSISTEDGLISAYAKAIANMHFLSMLENDAPHGPRWARSAFTGYYWDGRIYIDADALTALSITIPRITIEINERIFVDSNRISVSDVSISFCDIRHAILIKE